jgi:hypothetical protein
MRSTLGVGKLAVTGYCFGGRYSFRFVDAARTVKADVAFAAHPSAWVDGEVSAIGAATAVATAGKLSPHFTSYMLALGTHVTCPRQGSGLDAQPEGTCQLVYDSRQTVWNERGKAYNHPHPLTPQN